MAPTHLRFADEYQTKVLLPREAYESTPQAGGYVKDNPVPPVDLAATIFTFLGIDPNLEYDDHFMQIKQRTCVGTPLDIL